MTAVEEVECPHGLGDPAWCYLCNGHAERDRKAKAADASAVVTPVWSARFPGTCSCGEPIEPGHRIVQTRDERYHHERCVPS